MIVAAFARAFADAFPDLVDRRVLVGLSGGADSMALLHLLHAAREQLHVGLAAAHVHHHVRAGEADEDAAFCGEACRGLGVELVTLHLSSQPPRGLSPEAWWRQERYRLLEEARDRIACAAVATAHTLDDQAETVLLKILRGAGPRGVAGIRRRQGNVVRPLLDIRRAALREWLLARGVSWREDSSNTSTVAPRGWVRHEVMPLLLSRAPRVAEHLVALAGSLAADDALLTSLLTACAPPFPEVAAPVSLAAVRSLPPSLRTRWVLALAEHLPLAEPPSRIQLAAIDSMLDTRTPAAVDLGRRWVLRRRRGSLHLSPPPVAPFAAHAATVPSSVALPGGFVAHLGRSRPGGHHVAHVSGRLAGLPLAWRSLRPEERTARIEGGTVGVLLARVAPPEWRRAWPVLDTGGSMVWIPGVAVMPGWEADSSCLVAELEEPWGHREKS